MWARRFRPGELVEVRSEAEILATLDPRGMLDRLPFMPEMLKYCGMRFRVSRRAEKTCDTIAGSTSRRMIGAVHLENLRCSGEEHGGCQARCLLFWKDEWLKKVDESPDPVLVQRTGLLSVTRDGLRRATQRASAVEGNDLLYICQATELPGATMSLAWWDPRQYLREVAVGNVSLRRLLRVLGRAALNAMARRLTAFGMRPVPSVEGVAAPTPTTRLDLEPGERVRVRPLPEILPTLDTVCRAKGLSFDVEMVRFCGQEFTVSQRIDRLIDERSGRMLKVTKDCIVLDGAVCSGCLSRERLFCPREIPAFWREGWLERVHIGATDSAPAGEAR